MKHTKVVTSTDPSLTPSETLPDRSRLAELYTRQTPPTQATPSPAPEPNADTAAITISQTLVSVLLTIPLLTTYFAATFIYNGTEATMTAPDPLFPLLKFFVSAICVLSWIVSFRMLRNRFVNYAIRLSLFLIIYLFYLFPALEIVYGGPLGAHLGIFTTIILWLTFTRLAVLYIIWSLNKRTKASSHGTGALVLPIVALGICAVLF